VSWKKACLALNRNKSRVVKNSKDVHAKLLYSKIEYHKDKVLENEKRKEKYRHVKHKDKLLVHFCMKHEHNFRTYRETSFLNDILQKIQEDGSVTQC
jgi:hypothetical protein